MRCSRFGSCVITVCVLFTGSSAAWAKDLYVQAKNNPQSQGNGTNSKPFTSLAEVESNSEPGDAIHVLPSNFVLDGGIQLKDGQSLIGVGAQVTEVPENAAHAQISNSTGGHLSGDAIRLADNNTVQNIHVIGAYRGGILGVNVASAVIENNLITENMNQHSVQTLQTSFVIFQPQRNHYGAITLFACGTTSPNECQDEDPATVGLAAANAVIRGNVIHDVNVEGIVILNDAGVATNYSVQDNSVDRVSMVNPGFLRTDLLPPLVPEVVRSRAFTMIVGNGAHAVLDMDHFDASHLAPPGDYASDGVVLVTFGNGAVITGDLSDITVTNPDFTGETVNGDSLELTAFGNNAVFDVRVRRAFLSDSVSTLVKLLEVGPTNGNSYFFDIADSVLSNVNPRVAVEASNAALAYIKIGSPGAVQTNTVDISVKDTRLIGHRRGLLINLLNNVNLGTLRVFAENSTFASTNPNEGFRLFNQGGVISSAAIDLGGGSLGSQGNNSFFNNAQQDLAVVNLHVAPPPLIVSAANNYWGGGAPVPGVDTLTTGPVVLTTSPFLTTNPNP